MKEYITRSALRYIIYPEQFDSVCALKRILGAHDKHIEMNSFENYSPILSATLAILILFRDYAAMLLVLWKLIIGENDETAIYIYISISESTSIACRVEAVFQMNIHYRSYVCSDSRSQSFIFFFFSLFFDLKRKNLRAWSTYVQKIANQITFQIYKVNVYSYFHDCKKR